MLLHLHCMTTGQNIGNCHVRCSFALLKFRTVSVIWHKEVEQSHYVHHMLYYGEITRRVGGCTGISSGCALASALSTVAVLVCVSVCSLSPCNALDRHYSMVLWIPSARSFAQLLEATVFWRGFLRQDRKCRAFNLSVKHNCFTMYFQNKGVVGWDGVILSILTAFTW